MVQTNAGKIVIYDEEGMPGTCDPFAPGTDRVWATFGARRVQLPTDHLIAGDDGSYRLPLSLGNYLDETTEDAVVIPLVAETVAFRTVTRETAKVRINTTVREEEEEVSVPVVRETVDVERIPIGRIIDQPISARREGDTLILPVLEEVLVVEKKLLLKEEVRVTTKRTETEQTERITLRKEEVSVERTNVDDSSETLS